MELIDQDVVQAPLWRSEATGRLDGLEIEYWTGGGHPPPFYRSEQLRLLTVAGIDTVEFATVAYAPAFPGAALVLKFQLAACPEEIRTVARLLRETAVFTAHYPEEEDPQTPDQLRTEVIVREGGWLEERSYHRRTPPALAPLQAEIARLIEVVKAKGAVTVFQQDLRLGV
jgi:hypothetical protein